MVELQAKIIGSVQGVGFRHTTKRLADKRKLAGYVRNCADGSVEILAQGRKEELNGLLEELKEHFGAGSIEKMERVFRPVQAPLKNFIIR